jgi:hypothetical protein
MSAKVPRVEINCPGCGKVFSVRRARLEQGRGRFCSRACNGKINGTKHGHSSHTSSSPTYTSWQNMRRRCENPSSPKYATYGAIGITVCDRWNEFAAFLEDMGERPAGKTLDRYPNKAGNYEPGNCRWATPQEQSENLKTNVAVTYGAELIQLSALARMLGVHKKTLQYRISTGWPESEWGSKAWGGNRLRGDGKE